MGVDSKLVLKGIILLVSSRPFCSLNGLCSFSLGKRLRVTQTCLNGPCRLSPVSPPSAAAQIVDKALEEPKYSSLYAQLCLRLAEDAPNFDGSSSEIQTSQKQSTVSVPAGILMDSERHIKL